MLRRLGNRFRPALESLESRRLLATITVNSVADNEVTDGQVTLREAIRAANENISVDGSAAGEFGVDTIRFDESIDGLPIVLNGTQLEVEESLVLLGNGVQSTIIDGNDQTRIMSLLGAGDDQAVSYEISGIRFEDARSRQGDPVTNGGFGGAISFSEARHGDQLIVRDSLFQGNEANVGAAIFVNGNRNTGTGGVVRVLVERSTFTQGTADFGGAIAFQTVSAVIVNSTIHDNQAANASGGIDHSSPAGSTLSTIDIVNVTLTENTAPAAQNLRNAANQGEARMTVQNSVILGDESGDDIRNAEFENGTATLISRGHNFVHHRTDLARVDTDQVGFLNEAGLRTLGFHGGTVPTRSLHPLSPLVDRGANNLADDPGPDLMLGTADDAALTTDGRGPGFSRVVDAGSGTATVDIGAFEVQVTLLIPDELVVNSDDDFLLREQNVDFDSLTFREAVGLADLKPGQNQITFDPSLHGNTITLTGFVIWADEGVEIVGPGSDLLTIDGDDGTRLLGLGSETQGTSNDFVLQGLTLANGNTGGGGGALFVQDDNFTIDDVIFRDSTAGNAGGAFYAEDANTHIRRAQFLRNNAGRDSGGAVYATGGQLRIQESIFEDNEAQNSGGGLFATDSITDLASSTFIRNVAGQVGGGAALEGLTATLANITFTGNDAFDGGGLSVSADALDRANVLVHSSTFAENTAVRSTDLRSDAASNALESEVRIANSVFASGNGSLAAEGDSEINSAGHNLVADESLTAPAPNDLTRIDARLGPLVVGQFGILAHLPLNDSPLLDAGSGAILPNDSFDLDGDDIGSEPLSLDALGNPRVVDLPEANNASDGLDIGAVELGEVVNIDYGDAPDPPYETATGIDVPRHSIGSLFLGAQIDAELGGLPTELADGDGADDDGITASADLVTHPTIALDGALAVSSSGVGKLDGWFDFNRDGDFLDDGEQIADAIDVAGLQTITFEIPAGTAAGEVFARFRLSPDGGTASDSGLVENGEIEDYRFELVDGSAGIEIDVRARSGETMSFITSSPNVVVASAGVPVVSLPAEVVSAINITVPTTETFRLADLSGQHTGAPLVTINGRDGGAMELSTMWTYAFVSRFRLNGIQANRVSHSNDFPADGMWTRQIAEAASTDSEAVILDVEETTAFSMEDGWTVAGTTTVDGEFAHLLESNGAELTVVPERPWTNSIETHDVTATQGVTALDALVIINQLQTRQHLLEGTNELVDPTTLTEFPGFFFDTTGEGELSALDALRVINFIFVNSLGSSETELIEPELVLVGEKIESTNEPSQEIEVQLEEFGQIRKHATFASAVEHIAIGMQLEQDRKPAADDDPSIAIDEVFEGDLWV